MQKQVVRFERETTVKDDICYANRSFKPIAQGISCSNCRVHLLTDRFLSKHFQKEIMKDNREYPNGIYPYVIIIDTALCNLRCRACYSWIYWKPEPRAMATFVDEDILAKQFKCKIDKLSEEELIGKKPRVAEKNKRPFSRLRISGGEPLFDQKGTLDSFSEGDSTSFWLSFFNNLDNEFEELISNNKLTLKSENDWVSMTLEEREKEFPIFLRSDNGKVRVRFDTNGWLFRKKEFADRFIGGIYDLALKNIKIDLTFSMKGTNSQEVDWFVSLNSEFDPSKIKVEEELKNHPQWGAIKNIIEVIKNKEKEETLSKKSENIISETYFNACGEVSLTIEMGIMHNPKEKLYLYDKDALNWIEFEEKLKDNNLFLSNTENRIYLGKYPAGTAWRYLNSGNYELRLKCPYHSEIPFLSYSKLSQSKTKSIKHRQINNYKDSNLNNFVARLSIQHEKEGTKCKYCDKICDYWIEMIPITPSTH